MVHIPYIIFISNPFTIFFSFRDGVADYTVAITDWHSKHVDQCCLGIGCLLPTSYHKQLHMHDFTITSFSPLLESK